jgi:hypothetical protein
LNKRREYSTGFAARQIGLGIFTPGHINQVAAIKRAQPTVTIE